MGLSGSEQLSIVFLDEDITVVIEQKIHYWQSSHFIKAFLEYSKDSAVQQIKTREICRGECQKGKGIEANSFSMHSV